MLLKDIALIIHFLGLAMGVGFGIAMIFAGMAAAKMEKSQAQTFMMNILGMARMADIGITLIILSGLALLYPILFQETATFSLMHFFHLKLTLVFFLLIVVGFSHKYRAQVKRENGGPALLKLKTVGRIGFLLNLGIIISAVIQFH